MNDVEPAVREETAKRYRPQPAESDHGDPQVLELRHDGLRNVNEIRNRRLDIRWQRGGQRHEKPFRSTGTETLAQPEHANRRRCSDVLAGDPGAAPRCGWSVRRCRSLRDHGDIGRYVSADNIRLVAAGLVAGLGVGVCSWALRARRWGAVPVVLAVVLAVLLAYRHEWRLRWDGMAVFALLVILVAGLGAADLVADPAVPWPWVAAGVVMSAIGVWAGVPENAPAVLVGSAVTGLAAAAAATRSTWAPSAGFALAAVVGWSVLIGAVGHPWAKVGGALCCGVAPWFAVRRARGALRGGLRPGPWLFLVHAALAVVAARWIAVVPEPGWGRVSLVAAAGLLASVLTRASLEAT